MLFSEELADLVDNLSEQSVNGHPIVVAEIAQRSEEMDGDECAVLVVGSSHPFVRNSEGFHRGIPVIVVSGHEDVTEAVQFMKIGACDVLARPVSTEQLLSAVRSALGRRHGSKQEHPSFPPDNNLVGTSSSMQFVQNMINAVAVSDANIFVHGESGTGKELVARAIHARSKRTGRPFVAINCAALPRDILENELFGHERGAFTGATNQKAGCFEQADGGTLFLDEIGEMTVETQAKLLRVIEAQTFRRLGGKQEIRVDVRIVAATNCNVAQAVEKGNLRSDLYYRLSVVELPLPPLRDRRDDIPLLAHHFLKVFSFKYDKNIAGFSGEYLERLQSYPWPGNVRELRNAIERAVVICPANTISSHDLPQKIRMAQEEIQHISIPIGSTVEEAEKKLILETLSSVGNNKAKAARILGVSRKTLHNKLNTFRWETDAAIGGGEELLPEDSDRDNV